MEKVMKNSVRKPRIYKIKQINWNKKKLGRHKHMLCKQTISTMFVDAR